MARARTHPRQTTGTAASREPAAKFPAVCNPNEAIRARKPSKQNLYSERIPMNSANNCADSSISQQFQFSQPGSQLKVRFCAKAADHLIIKPVGGTGKMMEFEGRSGRETNKWKQRQDDVMNDEEQTTTN